MDELERLEATINKYEQYSYDYEKRFITSLSLISGASLGFCITFSQTFDDPERFLHAMLFSMWCFLGALALSGSLTFLMAQRYDKLSLGASSSRLARIRKLAEETNQFEGVNKYISAEVYQSLSNSDYSNARRIRFLFLTFSGTSALLIFIGLSVPLIILSTKGYF